MSTTTVKLPLTDNGVFWSIQGEGHLRGFQMCFVRIAGCSVACPECDTNYEAAEVLPVGAIVERVKEITPLQPAETWVWITGGEPADYPRETQQLIRLLHSHAFSVAVATSGHKRFIPPVEWLSVSPHNPEHLTQIYGNEIKLVDGLHALRLEDWKATHELASNFFYRYVQPRSVGGIEIPSSLARCMDFLKTHPRWALSRQDHHHWRVA